MIQALDPEERCWFLSGWRAALEAESNPLAPGGTKPEHVAEMAAFHAGFVAGASALHYALTRYTERVRAEAAGPRQVSPAEALAVLKRTNST